MEFLGCLEILLLPFKLVRWMWRSGKASKPGADWIQAPDEVRANCGEPGDRPPGREDDTAPVDHGRGRGRCRVALVRQCSRQESPNPRYRLLAGWRRIQFSGALATGDSALTPPMVAVLVAPEGTVALHSALQVTVVAPVKKNEPEIRKLQELPAAMLLVESVPIR